MKEAEDFTADGRIADEIATAMIVNRRVLGAIAGVWDKRGLFSSPELNLIGKVCVRYFRKHKKSPRRDIATAVAAELERRPLEQKDSSRAVALIQSLSNDHATKSKEINPDHVLDLAQRHFDKINAVRFAEEYGAANLAGNFERAAEIQRSYRRIELSGDAGKYAENPAAYEGAFAAKAEPLITYSHGLGKFFGDQLGRGTFFAFVAPEKRGKSIWLLELAFAAQQNRKRVAFFEAGDMTEAQLYLRISARAKGRPFRRQDIRLPTGITMNGKGCEVVEYKDVSHDKPMTGRQGNEAYVEFLESVRSHGKLLWTCCYPTGTLSVDGVRSALEAKERRDRWTPDVVVIDYADLLAPPKGTGGDIRDKINATWAELRGLSMEKHILLLTATQANRASYNVETITMDHVSEDKRKLSYPNGLIGINVHGDEKRRQVTRLNWIALRDDEHHPLRCVHCVGCPAIYKPAMHSVWPDWKKEERHVEEDEK